MPQRKSRIKSVPWVSWLDPTNARDRTNPYSPLNRRMALFRIRVFLFAIVFCAVILLGVWLWELMSGGT